MLSTAIILFREVLEAALIIGIACAATRSVRGRSAWIGGGVAVGIVLAGLVAAGAGTLAQAASGTGQELFNAAILLAAVGMLGWHNIWMAQHGREMAAEMNALGKAVSSGGRPLYAIGLVVALAVLREGAEVVLFLYGIGISEGGGTGNMLLGGALGVATGAAAGVILYFGLLKVPVRHFFSVTGWMVLLLAAGLASQAAHYLIQAGVLPTWGDEIWDSSAVLSADSVAGQVLHTLVGYEPQPAGMQLVFYGAVLLIIGSGMKWLSRAPAPRPRAG